MTDAAHDDHGNTPAAWTCVGLLIVGSFLISLSLVLVSQVLLVAGLAVSVVGLVAGKILQLAGYGKEPLAPPAPSSN
jgi:membrane-bound ClpP family serine protease